MIIIEALVFIALSLWLLYAVVQIAIGIFEVVYGVILIVVGSVLYVLSFPVEWIVRLAQWVGALFKK